MPEVVVAGIEAYQKDMRRYFGKDTHFSYKIEHLISEDAAIVSGIPIRGLVYPYNDHQYGDYFFGALQ